MHAVAVAGAAVVISIAAIIIRKMRQKKDAESEYPKNTVIVHQFGKGPYAPSISPFVVKLETFLRMANISYKPAYDRQMSSKGKVPWIEYNEEKIADSAFCIDYLNKKFDVNLSSHLSEKELATARAFSKMVEENLYWYLLLQRSTYDTENVIFREVGLNSLIIKILQWKGQKAAYHHGMGRHTEKEVTSIMERDIKAISDFLGEKNFFMGERPSEVDCVLFGQLCQFVWQMPNSPAEQLVKGKYRNIQDYCTRMKELYWPDWEDCTLKKKPAS